MVFWNSNNSDSDVENVTNVKNTEEDWAGIMNLCDKIGDSEEQSKTYLRSIFKRINHEDPHVQLLAITVLDACVKNCGKNFRLAVATREFYEELKKSIVKSQSKEPKVGDKLKLLLKKWAEDEFKSDDQLHLIPSLYKDLLKEGVSFPKAEAERPKGVRKEEVEEINDLSKAIELSLLECNSPQKSSASTNSSLYPSTKITSTTTEEYRKVRALYDFEAAEDNELTFKAGEIIFVMDDSDSNWWKGYNQNGEGLFPANFVSADLSVEPEATKAESSKPKVSFDDNVKVVKIPSPVEINEAKIDRLLHLLHEADPSDEKSDTEEMLNLEEEVNAMGPLIDAELERVDRQHAQLTQLSTELVEALNLYHKLMREPMFDAPPQSYFNGLPSMPPSTQFMSMQHPHTHFPPIPGTSVHGPQSLPPVQPTYSLPQNMLSYIGSYQPSHINYGQPQHLPPQQPMSPNASLPPRMMGPVIAPYPPQINQPVTKLKPDFQQ